MLGEFNKNLVWRKPSLVKAGILTTAFHLFKEPIIVEIGSQRHGGRITEDGQSTMTLGDLTQTFGGRVYSVDSSKENLSRAERAVRKEEIETVEFIWEDGESYLREFPLKIDLLYLDGGDDPLQTKKQFLAALGGEGDFWSVRGLRPSSMVIIDDCMPYGGREFGKGDLLMGGIGSWKMELTGFFGRYRMGIMRNEG